MDKKMSTRFPNLTLSKIKEHKMELFIMLGLFIWIMAGMSPEFKEQLLRSKKSFVAFMRG